MKKGSSLPGLLTVLRPEIEQVEDRLALLGSNFGELHTKVEKLTKICSPLASPAVPAPPPKPPSPLPAGDKASGTAGTTSGTPEHTSGTPAAEVEVTPPPAPAP